MSMYIALTDMANVINTLIFLRTVTNFKRKCFQKNNYSPKYNYQFIN